MDTKDVGDISELKVITALKEQGYPVLIPYGDNQRYDLAYEEDDGFVRVQVKTAREDDGRLLFNAYNTGHNNNGNYSKEYTKEDIDVFMVYSPDTEEIYEVSVEETGSSTFTLRHKEADFDHPNINWAEDYRFTT